MTNKLLYFNKTFILLFFFSTWAVASLTPQQEEAKNQGIILYNQYKSTSAVPHLKVAAEAGDREAQYYLGEALRLNSHYMTSEAEKWYIAAANQGDYYAMFRLSNVDSDLCSIMDSCSADIKRPKEWLQKLVDTVTPLAKKGDAEAMMILYNTTGKLEWLEEAAEAGYARAQWLLAGRYEEGEGVFLWPGSRQESIEKWTKAAAEGGFPKAMMNYVALLYKRGDLASARIWQKKAAETGYESGVTGYGAYLAHTPDRLKYPLDIVKGYALTSLLKDLDGGGNVEAYVDDVLPQIEEKMTPQQLEEAQQYAKDWKATHPPLSFYPDKLGF